MLAFQEKTDLHYIYFYFYTLTLIRKEILLMIYITLRHELFLLPLLLDMNMFLLPTF